jgi:site-specific recombinase XerC
LDKNILPVFGTTAIADIDYGRLSKFVEHLSQQGLSTITIQQHLVAVRKVLTHAYTHGAIPALPKSPTVRVVSTPRGGFTVAEYRQVGCCCQSQLWHTHTHHHNCAQWTA